MRKRILLITFFLYLELISSILWAQNPAPVRNETQAFFLKTQFNQFKDSLNYGLVFNGVNLDIGYSLIKTSRDNVFSYTPAIGFGANFNKGLGIALSLKPVDVFYGYHIDKSKPNPVIIGAYFATNYRWQAYPELQSGHILWFTSIEAGPQISFTLPFQSNLVKITFANSLAGYTSRPEPVIETTFYWMEISDFISKAHSGLKFGSFNLFSHTRLEAELLKPTGEPLFLTYAFEYFGYHLNPTLSYLNHSLTFKWRL